MGEGVHLPPGLGLGVGWVWVSIGTRGECVGRPEHPRPDREGNEPLPYERQRQRRGKNRNRLPPKVLRLKRRPIVCFVWVAGDINRTMLRLGEVQAKPAG